MKIVFISSRSLNKIGGIETYMKNLCPLLVKKGHEVILYTEDDKWGSYDYKGVKVITIASIRSKFFNKILASFIATFHSLILQRNVDIYHYNAMAAGFFSFVPKMLGKTVVFQGHGFEWRRAKWSPAMRKIIKFIDDVVILFNNNIIMVSEEQSEYIENKGKKSVTITPGVDIIEGEVSSNIFKKYNIQKNNYILYLGRLVPEKKADILMKSFLKIKNKNLQLVIAGDDPNEKKYIEYLKNIDRENKKIIFTGAVYGNDKEALLQNCYCFCIPSELEGLPITLLEAMSYGKICIASDIQANKEALGDTGIFFKVNDIKDLSQKIDKLDKFEFKIGEEAKKRVLSNFTWEIIASKFDEYYKQLKGK